MAYVDLDRFKPRKRHIQLAHLLQGESHGLSRKILYQLLGQPLPTEEISISIGQDAEGLSVRRTIQQLQEAGLVKEVPPPADQAGSLPRWQITVDGAGVLLTLQTLGPVQSLTREILEIADAEIRDRGPEQFLAGDGGDGLPELLDEPPSDGGKRKIWHVTRTDDGSWKVKREGASRATGRFDTKKEAQAEAKDIARKRENGRVVLHRRDGSIQGTVEPK